MKICIDAGHGGHDPGAVAGSLRECDIALLIAEEAADCVEADGHEAVMTRETDRAVSLSDRCRVSNRAMADRFVSIHVNASSNADARGCEAYHCDRSATGMILARSILDAILGAFPDRSDRGIKPDNRSQHNSLYVLRHTICAAALVEVGFITNESEREWMLDHIREIGAAIAAGTLRANTNV